MHDKQKRSSKLTFSSFTSNATRCHSPTKFAKMRTNLVTSVVFFFIINPLIVVENCIAKESLLYRKLFGVKDSGKYVGILDF